MCTALTGSHIHPAGVLLSFTALACQIVSVRTSTPTLPITVRDIMKSTSSSTPAMSIKAIADAATSDQALLSAALNAKDTKVFCVSTAAFEGRTRSAASPELVARVYEKLHEIMSILEEDQKVQEVKGLLDMQAWEELTGEMMEIKTPESEIARENVEVVQETSTKMNRADEKLLEAGFQEKAKAMEATLATAEQITTRSDKLRAFACHTFCLLLLTAAITFGCFMTAIEHEAWLLRSLEKDQSIPIFIYVLVWLCFVGPPFVMTRDITKRMGHNTGSMVLGWVLK
ncbi:hypothetical protein LTR17_001239 [Elasticomyces elasticus]|nr:hypothetical protein LTR17_001239 [Elasticomyces elasticus]